MTDAIRGWPGPLLLFCVLVTTAVVLAFAVVILAALFAQWDDARRARADETAAWRASNRARHEDADRVPDHDWPYGGNR